MPLLFFGGRLAGADVAMVGGGRDGGDGLGGGTTVLGGIETGVILLPRR